MACRTAAPLSMAALALAAAGPTPAQDAPAFLIDAQAFASAARIVAAPDGRTLLVPGDHAYALGSLQTPLATASGAPRQLHVLRQATAPVRDAATGALLGHEARAIGTARLRQAASTRTTEVDGHATVQTLPAVIDIVTAREEVRVGDLLITMP